jgi:hypothetical protein
MKWVKGELIDSLIDNRADPRRHLSDQSDHPPFDRLTWFQRVARHWSGGARPLVARAWNEMGTAWLFLALRSSNHAVSLSNWYSFAYRPIFSGEPDGSLLKAIAKRLRKAKSVPSCITLAPVPRGDGSSDLVLKAFRTAGWIAMRHQSSTSWIANVSGKSFDEYWAERPGQLRNTFQRKAKKASISAEVKTSFSEEDWAAYESVYGESWKPEEGAAQFLKDMAIEKSALGCYRLGLAYHEDRVVAAQFWIVSQGIAYIHKLAHCESAKELSPGTILSVALFRHVIDIDHVRKIDFGTGNDKYKADWMDESHPLDTIRLFKTNSIIGLASALRAQISALVHKTPVD